AAAHRLPQRLDVRAAGGHDRQAQLRQLIRAAAMAQGTGYDYRDNTAHFDAQSRMGHLTAYYGWVLDLFGTDIAFPAADAGAGSGHFASLLRLRGGPLLLLEGGSDNLAELAARFDGDAG